MACTPTHRLQTPPTGNEHNTITKHDKDEFAHDDIVLAVRCTTEELDRDIRALMSCILVPQPVKSSQVLYDNCKSNRLADVATDAGRSTHRTHTHLAIVTIFALGGGSAEHAGAAAGTVRQKRMAKFGNDPRSVGTPPTEQPTCLTISAAELHTRRPLGRLVPHRTTHPLVWARSLRDDG